MCYTDIVYVPLFNLQYIRAFKLNKPLHKCISPTFTWARHIYVTLKPPATNVFKMPLLVHLILVAEDLLFLIC